MELNVKNILPSSAAFAKFLVCTLKNFEEKFVGCKHLLLKDGKLDHFPEDTGCKGGRVLIKDFFPAHPAGRRDVVDIIAQFGVRRI